MSEDELVERVAARVVEMLGAGQQAPVYTSLALPPDCPTRSRFRAVAPGLPGAYKQGKCWIVGRDAWHAARTKNVAVRTPSIAERAEAALKAAGYRKSK